MGTNSVREDIEQAFSFVDKRGAPFWRTTRGRFRQFSAVCTGISVAMIAACIYALNAWSGVIAFEHGLLAGIVPAVTVVLTDVAAVVLGEALVAALLSHCIKLLARFGLCSRIDRLLASDAVLYAEARRQSIRRVE